MSSTKETTARDGPLERAEAVKEAKSSSSGAAPDGMVGEDALDAAIGDDGGNADAAAEVTSAGDDPLEEAEAAKERS